MNDTVDFAISPSSEAARVPGPGIVRVYPFGGVGEFGMNCLAIEQEDGILVVDCGASFQQRELGVDLQHADFSWLKERAARVVGLVLTHGHEDHIGAVPHFLARIDVPVWGSRYALGLVKRRAGEGTVAPALQLRETVPRQRYAIGPFEVEPVRVAHSIVEATALHIKTRAGSLFHTGDFNFDADPPDGEPTDTERLSELGAAGIALLMSDSTNSDVAERPGSEREVGRALERIVEGAPGRVVIAMFSSNVQRLRVLGEVAARTNRKLCLLGRSLETHARLAGETGRLRWPSDLQIAPDDAHTWPAQQLLVLAGGTQAEAQSGLRRLASGTSSVLDLEAGDTVVLSSRIIPGNERGVSEMICDFLRQGVMVRHQRTDPDVHTSGHAGRSEQRRMLQLLQPKAFMPLHGTLHHLLKHAELARSVGVPSIEVVENGTPLELDGTTLTRLKPVVSGKVAIAVGGRVLPKAALQQRAELARLGVVVVSVTIGPANELIGPVRIFDCGIPLGESPELVKERIERIVKGALSEVPEPAIAEGLLCRRVRRALQDVCGYRPIVEVHLTRCTHD